MTETEKADRLRQLHRLRRQVQNAIDYLCSDRPFMPLQDHIHPASLHIGDFVIVDLLARHDYPNPQENPPRPAPGV